MKHKFLGIYGKVFFYTLLILISVLVILFLFFSNQMKGIEYTVREQQVSEIFRPFYMSLEDKTEDEIIALSKEFHKKNEVFEFSIEAPDGNVLFQTEEFQMPDTGMPGDQLNDVNILAKPGNGHFKIFTENKASKAQFISLMSNGYKLCVSNLPVESNISKTFTQKLILAFFIIMLVCIVAAAFFAGRIAKPIHKIADDTRMMSQLREVSEPNPRSDEIGQLAADVYTMYSELKYSIKRLEDEIEKEREMEENQRYFFAAASHELKTPIAAASALLEGMLEEVVSPEEYPAALRDCLKILSEQNRLISEILKLSTLSQSISSSDTEELGLEELVNSVYLPCTAIAEAKILNVQVKIPKELSVRSNRKLLTIAFSNIIINAVQNTEIGGEIEIFAKESNNRICLSVLNKGSRIPTDILPKLFDPFFRENQSRSRSDGRTGLGLAIVKKIFDLLEIDFLLSNEEDGVLFKIDLCSSQ